jgi:hypothetical protein
MMFVHTKITNRNILYYSCENRENKKRGEEIMGKKAKNNQFKDFFKYIPVNYPVGTIYLNGFPVEVANFSNLNSDTGLAYFVDAEGQIAVLSTAKMDGVSFGAAEAAEEE